MENQNDKQAGVGFTRRGNYVSENRDELEQDAFHARVEDETQGDSSEGRSQYCFETVDRVSDILPHVCIAVGFINLHCIDHCCVR